MTGERGSGIIGSCINKKKGLKRPDGKLYTRQDIEDALRWANSGKYGETYNSKRTVHIGNQAPQSAIDKVMYDGGVGKHFESRLWLSSTNGNVTTFTQNLNNIKKPDTNLTKFIQEQAPSYKYSWDGGLVVAYQQPITATQPISPAKKISGSQSQISDRQLRSKDSAVINGGGGVDFSGGANIQAKSEKIINEQVMPVVQTGVGLAEVGTGTAMCATGVGCGVGSALIIHGSDNAVTGNANRGKTTNQQTSSVLLTQGVGLSEGTASNIKMGTDLALGGATAAQGVSRRVGGYATSSTQAAKKGETYFRVQGGGYGYKSSQERIWVNSDGTITINPGCVGQLCVSTLGADHAKYYLSEKRPGGQVVVFEVNEKTHKEIMDNLIPQRKASLYPNAPKVTDENKPGTSIELPQIWNKVLEQNSSSARILTEEQFIKEFGKYEKK